MAASSATAAATPGSRQALVERICASAYFRRANKLKAFLRHICERTLDGRAEDLKEHQIGTEVFGRKPGYNTGEDNIVRVQARLLRIKLRRFFDEEGKAEPVVLLVPRGGYIPEFVDRCDLDRPVIQPSPAAPQPQPPSRAFPAGLFLAAAAAFLAVAGVILWQQGAPAAALESTPASAGPAAVELYANLLGWPQDRGTLVVLSNPKVLLYRRFNDPGPLDESDLITLPNQLRGELASSLNNESADDGLLHYLERQPTGYTGIGEAASAYHIGILMERLGVRTRLTQGRFLDWQHARSDNLIVLGSPHINDWTLENLNQGELRFVPGGVAEISADGQAIQKYATAYDKRRRMVQDFGLISLLDLGGSKALILAGRSSPGTYGVGEFFANRERMQEVLEALAPAGGAAPARWQALVQIEIQEDLPVRAELVRVSAFQPPDL